MTLKLYNTLARKKEVFKPIKDGEVGLYSCGPTVYNYAHIGNLRTYVFNDVLRRTLKYNGYNLKHVMNITDVGHLTSDADSGEDKMLKGAKREKKTVYELAEFYTKAFMVDLEKLNIETPEIIPKATDHIKEMIEIIRKIEKNGYAYSAGGNIYFDTSKFKDYGRLARLENDDSEKKSRVDADKNKRNPNDFVLWFTKSKFDEQEMKWDSPFGKGYPGWHIECSAMSSKYLGEQFDIHTGGIDHIQVHHTNEIAQSEAAFNKHPWVKYWLHGEFLVIDKDKMAKSGDNFLKLQTLVDKGFDPIVYRYFCLTAHYKQQLKFSFDGLESSRNSFNALKNKVIEIKKDDDGEIHKRLDHRYTEEFKELINDDLNMPKVLALMYHVLKDEKISNKDKYSILLDFDRVLGLGFKNMKEEIAEVNGEIEALIKERDNAKKQKDFAKADKIRNELKHKGIVLEDSKDGTKWKKI